MLINVSGFVFVDQLISVSPTRQGSPRPLPRPIVWREVRRGRPLHNGLPAREFLVRSCDERFVRGFASEHWRVAISHSKRTILLAESNSSVTDASETNHEHSINA